MVIPFHDVNPVRRTPWVTYGGSVAYVADILGFVAGAVVGLIMRASRPSQRRLACYRA